MVGRELLNIELSVGLFILNNKLKIDLYWSCEILDYFLYWSLVFGEIFILVQFSRFLKIWFQLTGLFDIEGRGELRDILWCIYKKTGLCSCDMWWSHA